MQIRADDITKQGLLVPGSQGCSILHFFDDAIQPRFCPRVLGPSLSTAYIHHPYSLSNLS